MNQNDAVEQSHRLFDFALAANSGASRFAQYSTLLHTISDLATLAGYPISAFNPETPSKFPSLPTEQQTSLIEGLETTRKIYASAAENGLALRQNGLALAWWAIKSFNLQPLSDVFSYLKETDIVEIYDQNHVQIFRTFDFLKCVSYSLDEVYTHSWWELYERAAETTAMMIKVATEATQSSKPSTWHRPFPTHITKEKFSARLRIAQVESRLVSTLVDSRGAPRGYINAFSLLSVSGEEPSST